MSDVDVLAEGRFRPGDRAWLESLTTVGNGWISVRGAYDEPFAGETRATFLNGVFVTPPGGLSQQTAIPDPTDLRLVIDEEAVDLSEHPPHGYRRQVDLRSGSLTREILWRGARSGPVRVVSRRLVSAARADLLLQHVEVEALHADVVLEVHAGIDANVGSPATPAWTIESAEHTALDRLRVEAASVDGRHALTFATSLHGLSVTAAGLDSQQPQLTGRVTVPAGSRLALLKATRIGCSSTTLPPCGSVLAHGSVGHDCRTAEDDLVIVGDADAAYAAALAASEQAWAFRWRVAAVTVEGDEWITHALRVAAFQLLGCAPPHDASGSIGAKLLSGFGYLGHVFWDTDIFIVPWLTRVAPDLAANHIAYRHRGLAGARRKAERYGRDGAFYPWEATDTGEEVTPDVFTGHDGRPVPVLTGKIEEHISADVPWAVVDHVTWTADQTLQQQMGAEIILACGQYWAGRVQVDADGSGHIRDVIGPDEYHLHVDDNLFTNAMAAWVMFMAADLLERLPIAQRDAVLSACELTAEEVAGWPATAASLVCEQRADGVWEQFDGFSDLPEVDLSRWQPRELGIEHLIGAAEVNRLGVLKQADVIMALALLRDRMGDAEVHRANVAHYLPRTDHGSSLSLAMHALVLARTGDAAQALELLRDAAGIDLENRMGNCAAGLHAATQGGLLQAVLLGFLDVTLDGDRRPRCHPHLPEAWEAVSFAVVVDGRVHDLRVAAG